MAFSQFLQPDDSVRRWLTAALPLAIAPFLAETIPAVVQVVPLVTEAAPVVKKARQSNKATDTKKETGKTTDKTPRKRSPNNKATATAQ